jgi:dihydrofolate reductase
MSSGRMTFESAGSKMRRKSGMPNKVNSRIRSYASARANGQLQIEVNDELMECLRYFPQRRL